jgi:hypothetical protein
VIPSFPAIKGTRISAPYQLSGLEGAMAQDEAMKMVMQTVVSMVSLGLTLLALMLMGRWV